MKKIGFLIGIIVLMSFESLLGCSKCSYFYAFGTDEINVYWDYYWDNPEELLGCNLLRSEEPQFQGNQVNEELITSEDKDFYFLDTYNVNPNTVYFYRIEYIFPDDTLYCNLYAGSFEYVEFNIIDSITVELIAEPKIAGDFYGNLYLCEGGTSFWMVFNSFDFENILTIQLENQLLPENYYMYSFYNYDTTGYDFGNILTSHYHINQLLQVSTPEYHATELTVNSHPNPFSKSVQIDLNVPNGDYYEVEIYNCIGRLVRIIENKYLVKGDYKLSWDRKNNAGIEVENGLYYCIVKSGSTQNTIKLLVQ